MKLRNRNLLVITTLAVLTNGLSLVGIEDDSARGLARTIQCTSTINRNIEVAEQLRGVNGQPPPRAEQQFVSRFTEYGQA